MTFRRNNSFIYHENQDNGGSACRHLTPLLHFELTYAPPAPVTLFHLTNV